MTENGKHLPMEVEDPNKETIQDSTADQKQPIDLRVIDNELPYDLGQFDTVDQPHNEPLNLCIVGVVDDSPMDLCMNNRFAASPKCDTF